MSVNYEVKGGIARVLATENLIVEHKQCDTAQFNVQTRVLTLPMWGKATDEVFDLLVAHEVGHALYTPNIDWTETHNIPPQFVNVTEDARIEKLMKRRYGGLPKTFFKGYQQMQDDDFFCLENEDISKMNLADRANLHFKIGNFVDISFTPEEDVIIDMIDKAESFDDALNAAQALYEYCKQKNPTPLDVSIQADYTEQGSGGGSMEEQPPSDAGQQQPKDEGKSEESQESEESQAHPSADSDQPSTSGENVKGAGNTPKESVDEEPKVRTDDMLKNNLRDLINKNAKDAVYLEFPNVDLKNHVVDTKEVHKLIESHFKAQESSTSYLYPSPFNAADSEYQRYKTESVKEVNYLVKEFECRKAADSYARASTARTGILDCTKLHTYKYNEDLFKKVTTIPDGKNHGLVFILDWSGSMSKVMLQTLKQLYNLISFCKKCGIPFDVYAFTNNWSETAHPAEPENKNYQMRLDHTFRLMNFFSSKTSSRELEKQMLNIWRVAYNFDHWTCYGIPSSLHLSGTPLNETMMCLREVLPQFQKKNNVQKVHCILLTDGEGNPLQYSVHIKKDWIDPDTNSKFGYWGVRSIFYSDNQHYVRNRATGKVYKIRNNAYLAQDTLLEALQDEFVNVNFIGIRILENGFDAGKFMDYYVNFGEKTKLMTDWKKEKSFSISDSPYSKYFGIAMAGMDNQTDYLSQLEENATKIQIRNAMKKTLTSKKMNKKILNEFVQLIA